MANKSLTDSFGRRICVAPMMDCTDRHDRYLLRLISKHVLLYTEMITTGALLHGDSARFLAYDKAEHPLALQLGGSEPNEMAQCARMAQEDGYDEVNMNVGCPSDRVKSGFFGACLMAEPQRVADCVAAMNAAVSIPVTVKTRIGIDDKDSYEELCAFIDQVAQAGCDVFTIHARKAWLQGLSPKQNREIPPLCYDVVYRLKQDFPNLHIGINGGIRKLDEIDEHLKRVDSAMIGREAYYNPYFLSEIDSRYFNSNQATSSREEILEDYLIYIERQLVQGIYLKHMSRHLLGLFQGMPGAKAWRRSISENAYHKDAGCEVIRAAARHVLKNKYAREPIQMNTVALQQTAMAV